MDDKKKYVVAKGVSFVGNGKHYREGDDIDATAFKDSKIFEKMLAGDKPMIIPASSKKAKSRNDDDDVDDVDASGVTLDRAALEKLFVEKGIFNEEKVKTIPDDKLKKLAVKKGLVKQ